MWSTLWWSNKTANKTITLLRYCHEDWHFSFKWLSHLSFVNVNPWLISGYVFHEIMTSFGIPLMVIRRSSIINYCNFSIVTELLNWHSAILKTTMLLFNLCNIHNFTAKNSYLFNCLWWCAIKFLTNVAKLLLFSWGPEITKSFFFRDDI